MRTLLASALVLLLAPMADAQGAFLPYVGYNLDAEAPVVGVGARFGVPLPAPVVITAQPAVEVRLTDVDGLTVLQGDLNVVAEFAGASVAPFAGAGLALGYVDSSGSSDTEVGLNLVGGAIFNPIGFAQPFAQARYTIMDGGEALTVMGGVALGL